MYDTEFVNLYVYCTVGGMQLALGNVNAFSDQSLPPIVVALRT